MGLSGSKCRSISTNSMPPASFHYPVRLIRPKILPGSRGGGEVEINANHSFRRVSGLYGDVLVDRDVVTLAYRYVDQRMVQFEAFNAWGYSGHTHFDQNANHLTLKGYDKYDVLWAAFHTKKDCKKDRVWTYGSLGESHMHKAKNIKVEHVVNVGSPTILNKKETMDLGNGAWLGATGKFVMLLGKE
ncbi:hypothetical protein DXG01_003549 [Tephrocybe rancida]|nr:hypothetical protein DXG01_003549 [Tephrocybe rancida]